jgi:hypothetical protein
MKTLTLALATLLSGCAATLQLPEEDAFRPAPQAPEMLVTWIVSDDPTKECQRLAPRALGAHPVIPACASWSRAQGICTIVTGAPTTHQALGHEMRHCFEGHFHAKAEGADK